MTLRWIWITLLLTLTGWVVWDNWGRFVQPEMSTQAQASAGEVARGRYLAQIGGCVACHTQEGGALMSGGRPVETPFGKVYASNLTPSVTQGLGQWRAQDFWMALRWGRTPQGKLLLPAFPYNHTSMLTRADSDALFAWLQSLPAVESPVPAHTLTWPFGTQPVIAVWRSLFFKPVDWQPDPSRSQAWNRGAYLVQGLGHCATCHGKRNALGGFPEVSDLSGGYLQPQLWVAPSLVDARQTAWVSHGADELQALLKSGTSPHASAGGPMGEYVRAVSQHLQDEDAQAVVTYLRSRIQSDWMHDRALPTPSVVYRDSTDSASTLYERHCASCHGQKGEGVAGQYPALAGNPAVNLTPPDNLIQWALFGGFGPSTEQRPRPYGMPAFLFALSNEELAQLLTFVRNQWGNSAAAVTPVQVDRVRSAAR